MIPKIIHYCWFGRNPKPKLAEKCIKSWKKYCPEYEIIEWNEDNYDLSSAPLYVRQAYEAKRWAFVTDYIRLQVIYEHGGIYLDTDVELRKSLDPLLVHQAYFGFEDGSHINTGIGFGAEKGHCILKEMMNDYQDVSFQNEDGSFDLMPCPVRNTEIFLRHGLKQNNVRQMLDYGILILPSEYFCPLDYATDTKKVTDNTYSIHWFDASWQTKKEQIQTKKWKQDVRREQRMLRWISIRRGIRRIILNDERYEKIKVMLKKMMLTTEER